CGIGHADVHTSIFLHDVSHELLHARAVGHIELLREDLRAGTLADLRRRLLDLLFRPRADGHDASFFREALRCGSSHAFTCAGEENDFAFESSVHGFTFLASLSCICAAILPSLWASCGRRVLSNNSARSECVIQSSAFS